MSHLRRLGNRIDVEITPDADGFTGRECPNRDCEGYFKIEFGTGLQGESLPCHCPYCGHSASHDHFWTREQIEYVKSVAMRKISDALYKDFKKLEFKHPAKGPFGIGFSMKIERGRPVPIRYYREKRLETEVVCEQCTLHYAIYGVFAYCPDCGIHNSKQILSKNLDLAEKQLDLAATLDGDIASNLMHDALENVVSVFDGFGRETCRVRANTATDPSRAQNVSFQNLRRVQQRLIDLFALDIASAVEEGDWDHACRCFMKRHLLAHKMGVVDQQYFEESNDAEAVIGRKVTISPDEVLKFIKIMRRLGDFLVDRLPRPSLP
ncbi:MAG: hypothetical protein WBG24_15080 [Syntrophobacteria bacterium]